MSKLTARSTTLNEMRQKFSLLHMEMIVDPLNVNKEELAKLNELFKFYLKTTTASTGWVSMDRMDDASLLGVVEHFLTYEENKASRNPWTRYWNNMHYGDRDNGFWVIFAFGFLVGITVIAVVVEGRQMEFKERITELEVLLQNCKLGG